MKLREGSCGSRGVTVPGARHGRRCAVPVLAAKKDSSPWSTGGPKRGSGGGGSSGGKGGSGGGSAKPKGSGPAGGSGSGSGSGAGAGSSGSPWRDTPAKQGLPAKRTKGGASAGGFAAGLGVGRAGGLSSRLVAPPEVTMTDPVAITLLDELEPSKATPEPRWGTFCSHLTGEWVGQYAAYTPWEGKPEPAWMDERGKYVTVVYTRCLEHRTRVPTGAAEADVLLRRIGRCTKLPALADMRLPADGLEPPPAAAPAAAASTSTPSVPSAPAPEWEDVDTEALSFNAEGVVVFDGGYYSAGPEYIGQQAVKLVDDEALQELPEPGAQGAGQGGRAASGADASAWARPQGGGAAAEDYEEDEVDEDEHEDGSTLLPTSTSVFEQCLVDPGARGRVRLKLTLRIGQLESGEVDVEVLRILLFREEWLGPTATERLGVRPEAVKVLQPPCTDLPRPTPEQLQGSWNVFTVGATGVDEVDPLTGEERAVWVYSSTEEQQLWDASSAPPMGDDGGSYWLPGGLVLSLRMVDNYVPADLADSSDLDQSGSDSDADSRSRSGSASGSGSGPSSSHHVNGNGSSVVPRGVARGERGAGSGGGGEGEGRAYPRGLCLSTAWLWREGSVSVVEREYDGYGYLREVRLSQGVKGGWSGGRM
ncbi:hypothetical protein HYH03_000209 [Edaphochlamys debaryana]|uniref:Uncharacterized protein n=1 Tax=Edaphochlamys debaryana TaxID=47281 RepID=A0A835YFE8_9CHLO|nr:hypothetical protein HYH03_000209 [Edaphochlamys debaryana]|eukprot:KAG2501708.1 hypothetical protein HYH03_000209 [Edaphochlamys debaryana]